MDPTLIDRLNRLWTPIYPHLADWIAPWCPERSGRVLELGPFSGGISAAIRKKRPEMTPVCLLREGHLLPHLRQAFPTVGAWVIGELTQPPFQAAFDLVVFRGAFFFLTPAMLPGIFDVLRPGGQALIGGGFGPLTPKGQIDPIAGESRELNYRLGKKWISRSELEGMLAVAAIPPDAAAILESGGLWLLVHRTGPRAARIDDGL